MKRTASIEALISKSRTTFEDLKKQYDASLSEKLVREELKVDLKNIFENLRSVLDYLAHEIFEATCAGQKLPSRLYFPIRGSASDFSAAVNKAFPSLQVSAPGIFAALEAVQPYKDVWLGDFNLLNNANKHLNLTEQTRTEAREVRVSNANASVSWGPGVTFGDGVSVVGVRIDPRTQMPVPNRTTTTEVIIWVDFKFSDNGKSVLPFVEESITKVSDLVRELQKYI
ncbi:hypothetical protein IFT43_14880 [Oxalobacteraceae sp. CFBP 13708]|nr:hypothetical protein [Oxalobacteraceae sp. CFBP 13708]